MNLFWRWPFFRVTPPIPDAVPISTPPVRSVVSVFIIDGGSVETFAYDWSPNERAIPERQFLKLGKPLKKEVICGCLINL